MENVSERPTEHLPGDEKLVNAQEIMGRLKLGEIVLRNEVSPFTHSPEIITLVAQSNRSHTNAL